MKPGMGFSQSGSCTCRTDGGVVVSPGVVAACGPSTVVIAPVATAFSAEFMVVAVFIVGST